jgi:short-subunit dehydrogenase
VTLVARREERLQELAEEIRGEHSVRAETLGADLGDPDERARMLDRLGELGLTAEVLVNNAGFGSGGRFVQLDLERELEMVRLNVEAVVALCGRLVPPMVERGRGAVLNLASIAGFQPLPRQATYGGTKAFVLSFTEALHAELGGSGVVATALCPGPVRTEFTQAAEMEDMDSAVPEFLWSDSADVAEQGVRGLENGRRVVVPGAFNRATALGGQHAPRGLFLRAAERLYPVGR